MNTTSALLFPGQGAQDMGMGRNLAERNSDVMSLWKKAEQISGIPLRGIYWESGENMDDTARLQPALTVANIALWMELSKKFKPSCVAGHSLGEYSALVAASVLSIEKVLELVTLRGRLMAEADPDGLGAMAAIVKLNLATAEELIKGVRDECGEPESSALRIANYNTPGQFVASGTKKAIELLVSKARDFKGRAIPLAVSGAFHSPMMANASKTLEQAINKCDFARPAFPIYSNVTGLPATTGAAVKEMLLLQMTSSVQWINTINTMYNNGIKNFVECGPKNILGKMVGQILVDKEEGSFTATSITSPEDLQSFNL